MQLTPARLRMFAVMLAQPDHEWTTQALTAAVNEQVAAAVEAVRDTVYVLMADRLVEPVPFQRALTFRLTDSGDKQLRALISTSLEP